MSRRSNRWFPYPVVAAALVTVTGLVGVVPVDAQPAGGEAGETDTEEADSASVNPLLIEAGERVRDVLEAQPSGSGMTWSDALQRVAADLDTFDLETGEEKTSLTWNFLDLGDCVKDLGLRVDFVNEPEVFPALEGRLGDDLVEVQRRVGVGDDVELTGTWHVNRVRTSDKGKRPVGLRTAVEHARQLVETSLGRAEVEMATLTSELSAVTGTLHEERVRTVRELLWTDIALAEANVSELLVSAGYRCRSEEVGPSSWTVNGRYSYGVPPNETALKKRIQRLINGEGKDVVDRLEAYRSEVKSNPIRQHRIAADLEYRRDERYEFNEFLDAPLVVEPRSYLKATLAYSLRFESVEKKKKLFLPRYEVRGSWERSEDVDRTIDQGDRWVVSAIVIKPVLLFDSFVDLTVGVVWASRPEYVMDEDPDRMLGANLGLKLRLDGDTQPE